MNEQLSSWLDGESDDLAAERMVRSLKEDAGAFDDAQMTFLIGDALRGEMVLSQSFMARFGDALQAEPTIVAPAAVSRPEQLHRPFVALSAAASVAVFSVVGWFAFSAGQFAVPDATHDRAVVASTAGKSHVSENAKMQEYMAMHKQLSSYQAVAFNSAGQ